MAWMLGLAGFAFLIGFAVVFAAVSRAIRGAYRRARLARLLDEWKRADARERVK